MKKIIPVCLCLLFFLSACGNRDLYKKVKFPFDDKIYFTMSLSQLKDICGTPKETIDRSDLAKMKYYVYEQDVFGRKATVSYGFSEAMFLSKLVNVTITFDSITKDEVQTVLEQFSSAFSTEASSWIGYKNSFAEGEEKSKYRFAIENGATSIEFNTDYDGRILTIIGDALY